MKAAVKYLVRSIYRLYPFVVRVALSTLDRLIIIVSGRKQTNTVSFSSLGRVYAKKSQFVHITRHFLNDSGRVRDDLSVDRPCPVCLSEGHARVFCYSQDGFEYVICENCSMLYTSKILTPEAYEAFQAMLLESERIWMSEREEEKCPDEDRFTRYIGYLKRHEVRSGKLLDIGCFTGSFLECAKRAGFEPSGVEIHEDKAALAASKGFPVYIWDFEKFDIHEVYDIVTLWESLEHMNNPRLVLEKVQDILPYGGVVAFTVPSGNALSVKLLGGHCPWLAGFGHKNMFTPAAASYLLNDCGFKVVMLMTIGGPDAASIISYFQNRIGDMNSFQNWDRLHLGVYRPPGANLVAALLGPIVRHYGIGDLIFALGRKTEL